MPALTATHDVDSSRHAAANGNAADFMGDEVRTRISFLERPPRRPGAGCSGFANDVRTASSQAPADAPASLAARIQLLIRATGSASAIARRCGVSEGTVRNWRDGHSDMSRERCVTLARALDISLLWLVAGEGAMRAEPRAAGTVAAHAGALVQSSGSEAAPPSRAPAVDPQLLASALRLLQSYIGLAGGSLDSPQRAEVLVELYELLAHAGEPGHAERLVAFHATLGNLLRGNCCAPTA